MSLHKCRTSAVKIEQMDFDFEQQDDESEIAPIASSRESLRSFWIGVSGLAVLVILVSLSMFSLGKIDSWLVSRFYSPIGSPIGGPIGRAFWDSCYGVHVVIEASLIPAIVLGALVPVLYWRGGLMLRFLISTVLAITTMNLTTNVYMGSWGLKVPILQSSGILLCWIAMPAIFLCTPIKTRTLRLIVASCIMLLMLCLSLLHMFEAPRNINLLYWEALYGSAFCYALIRRNWGRVAILEAETSPKQLERTSSRTLLELMTVCGLACAVSMYWSVAMNLAMSILLVQAILLGIGCILASMTCIRIVLRRTGFKFVALVSIWFLVFLLFAENSIAYFLMGSPWARNSINLNSTSIESLTAVLIFSFFASLVYLAFMLAVCTWLRFNGWRMQSSNERE